MCLSACLYDHEKTAASSCQGYISHICWVYSTLAVLLGLLVKKRGYFLAHMTDRDYYNLRMLFLLFYTLLV